MGVFREELYKFVDGVECLANIFVNLQIEFSLKTNVDLSHVEPVQATLGKGRVQGDGAGVSDVIVQGNHTDDTLSNVHGVGIVFTLYTLHQNVVRVVCPHGGHGHN